MFVSFTVLKYFLLYEIITNIGVLFCTFALSKLLIVFLK